MCFSPVKVKFYGFAILFKILLAHCVTYSMFSVVQSHFDNSDTSKSTKVLLLSGLTTSGVHEHTSEILDLNVTNENGNTCENWAEYSPFTSGATGGPLGNKAIICGGFNSMQCYEVNQNSLYLIGQGRC